MDTVRVGFIGCGGIANWHFGHFEKMQIGRIVAVCDLIEERAQKAAERLGARPYTRYEEMLQKEELDAVYIAVEPSAHDRKMEFMVIDKGCHLFVQKPMTLDMDYAHEVRDALATKGLISSVGFQCRYAEMWPTVQTWLSYREVACISAYRMGGLPMVWWWRQKEHSGGQIVEQTIHNYDLLRMIFGDVVTVQGRGRRGIVTDVADYDTDDCSTVSMTFESGAVGTMQTGCFSRFGGQNNFFAFCRDAKLEFGFGSFTITDKNSTISGKSGNDMGQAIDETFMEAIRSGDPSEIRSPYADACKSLHLVLAAQQSIDSGGVPIDLV